MARSVLRRDVERLDRRASMVFHSMRDDKFVSNHDIICDLRKTGINITITQVDHYGRELEEQGFCTREKRGERLFYKRFAIVEAKPTVKHCAKEAAPMPDKSPEGLMERASRLVKELEEVHGEMLALIDTLDKQRNTTPEEEMVLLKEKARRYDQYVELMKPIHQ